MKKGFGISIVFVTGLLFAFFAGSVWADDSAPNWPSVYSHGPSQGKYVALTFDDAPMEGCDELLNILEDYDVHATFFIEGIFAAQDPDTLFSIFAHGHELGNHTFNHPDLTKVDDDRLDDELSRTNDVIRNRTGVIAHLFRPPGGEYNSSVLNRTYGNRFVTVLWTINTADYRMADPSSIVNRVVNRISPGGIILMHDGVEMTRRALPEIITRLRGAGYTFVTVGEMLEMTHGDCPWRTVEPGVEDSHEVMTFL